MGERSQGWLSRFAIHMPTAASEEPGNLRNDRETLPSFGAKWNGEPFLVYLGALRDKGLLWGTMTFAVGRFDRNGPENGTQALRCQPDASVNRCRPTAHPVSDPAPTQPCRDDPQQTSRQLPQRPTLNVRAPLFRNPQAPATSGTIM